MKITSALTVSLFILCSCEFERSVSQDLTTGMTTRGNGLSCENVALTDGNQKLKKNSFVYGEKFFLDFENIDGFKKKGDHAFPGMQLLVVSHAGDTVMQNDDLYASFTDGINISPLLLRSKITTADPMHSDQDYTLHVNIWDKKGEGTFNATMDFNIIPNDQIRVKSNSVSFDEIYLFSQERGATITDNHVEFNENLFLTFEGLEGFKEEAGKVYPGVSILIRDAEGSTILNEEDLMGESGIAPLNLKDGISPSFIFTGSGISNPVSCTAVIWDKKSESRIEASIDLQVK